MGVVQGSTEVVGGVLKIEKVLTEASIDKDNKGVNSYKRESEDPQRR